MMKKHQNSTINTQGKFKPRAPRFSGVVGLKFGPWNFSGFWNLILGICFAFVGADLEVRLLGAEPSALALHQAAQVNGEGVFLDQVLDCAGLPALWLCDAPAFGKTAVLTRAKVVELAKENAPELASTNWTGPETVRISRRAR